MWFQPGPLMGFFSRIVVLDNTLRVRTGRTVQQRESTGWTVWGQGLGRQRRMDQENQRHLGCDPNMSPNVWIDYFFPDGEGCVVCHIKAFNEAKVNVLDKRLRFGRLVFNCYYRFTVVSPAAEIKRPDKEKESARTGLFYTRAAIQKQPFLHFLFPRRVYLYSRPPPTLYDNGGNLLNQTQVYL